MSTAGIAAPEMRVPLKTAFLHNGQSLRNVKSCWSGRGQLDDSFFSMDPATVTYNLNPSVPDHLTSIGHISSPQPARSPSSTHNCSHVLPLKCSPDGSGSLLPGFSGLSISGSCASDEAPPVKSGLLVFPPAEWSARPLPPLPIAEDFLHHDDADKEVEFLTSSDTALLLSDAGAPGALKAPVQGRRSFRDCGQINYAYFEAPAGPPSAAGACPPPPPPLHRRLRRSHSGPAGSFNKPVVRVQSRFHRASPSSDDDKPEVPPRAPIPPRALKPDYRRWSAEVASNAFSDEDKPPKVPPREPLSRSNSRTPSPKSLPAYLHGVMPPTQSFAPDPKYVSSKALQRQHSEGSGHKVPCILPIIENGKKVSSTHYYLLPERPPYLDKYEKFFREAEETGLAVGGQLWGDGAAPAKAGGAAPVKRKHLPCMVSP